MKDKIKAIKVLLNDLERSYQEQIYLLDNTIEDFHSESGKKYLELIADSEQAVQARNNKSAKKLLTKVLNQGQQRITQIEQHVAQAEYLLGKITYNHMDYYESFKHHQRAIELNPISPEYLREGAIIAGIIGNYDKKIEWNEKALSIYDENKDLGDVTTIYNSLGQAWQSKREYDKAIDYFKLALVNDLKALDEDHPDVARDRNNLGVAWYYKGEYDKAIDYCEMALVNGLNILGDEHPNVASRRNNLGLAWEAKGEHDKAIGYYELALASGLNMFGGNHPDIAIYRGNLGSAWNSKGEYDKAIGYLELALTSMSNLLGSKHPDVIDIKSNLDVARTEVKNL